VLDDENGINRVEIIWRSMMDSENGINRVEIIWRSMMKMV